MPIVSTQVVPEGHTQRDGRRYVTEIHTDHLGVEHRLEYLSVDGADYTAIAAARVPLIEAQLEQAEIEAILNGV